MNTDHLESLRLKLAEEKAYLQDAVRAEATAKEIDNRKEFIAGIERLILVEIYFLKSKGILVE